MLWDLHQELGLRNVRANQRSLESQSRGRDDDLQRQLWDLEDRFERLLVVADALWRHVAEAQGLTDEDLLRTCAEVDAQSGVADGRRAREVRRCAACDAAVPHGRPTCVFCGAAVTGADSPFDRV